MKIVKRIADPIHGTIGLTELETRVIDTRVFQRLRNVKHLGLAHLVFPAADFSRFAHSIGVCHVTGRLLDALKTAGTQISDEDLQKYRLAGLLHDVGHYPLSHALEKPVKDHLKDRQAERMLEPTGDENQLGLIANASNLEMSHEDVGRIILEEDQELKQVLDEASILPISIADIFTRTKQPLIDSDRVGVDPLVNLVSSDLDADRIDYLLRSSGSTGLPYGAVDLDYILSQLALDRNRRVCLHERALRTVDHLLLARYFDTQQVAFHKTVAILEELAKDVVSQLLRIGALEIDENWIREAIRNRTWAQFDDAWLMRLLQQTYDGEQIDDLLRMKIAALLERRPPKLVAMEEKFRNLTQTGGVREFRRLEEEYRTKSEGAANHFNLDRDLFYVWTLRGFPLTKISSAIPVDELDQEDREQVEKWEQSVRILARGNGDQSSKTIMQMSGSLMNILSDHALDSVRLYLLEPPDRPGIATEVRNWLRERLT